MNASALKLSSSTEKAIDSVASKAGDIARDVQSSKDQLLSDFRALAVEAEKLLDSSADVGEDALADARVKLTHQLTIARRRLAELEAMARVKAKAAATATDDYVHHNPWQSIAIAGGVGVALGVVLGSRRGA